MVVIRLSRGGAKKRPFYKIVAADRRAPRDGSYLERLGYFNPIATGGEKRLEFNQERLDYWFSKGAKPSDRVQSLLREFSKPELLEKRKEKKLARKVKKKEKLKEGTGPEKQEEAKKASEGGKTEEKKEDNKKVETEKNKQSEEKLKQENVSSDSK